MFLVKNHLGPSAIHGIGVIVDEEIRKGQVVWVFDNRFDQTFTTQEVSSLPEIVQDYIKRSGWQDKRTGMHYLGGDNDTHVNHSPDATMTESLEDFNILVAARDLKVGDELTHNYTEFTSEQDFTDKNLSLIYCKYCGKNHSADLVC